MRTIERLSLIAGAGVFIGTSYLAQDYLSDQAAEAARGPHHWGYEVENTSDHVVLKGNLIGGAAGLLTAATVYGIGGGLRRPEDEQPLPPRHDTYIVGP